MPNNWNNVNNVCCKHWLVLPAVYSDALSYGDQIAKFCSALNKVIENNNVLPEYVQQMIQDYINGDVIGEVVQNIIANFILNVKYPPAGLKPAVGDGSADDTEAITGCLTYASQHNGMAVYFPSGAYSVTSLTVPSNVALFAYDRYTTKIVLRGGATSPLINSTGTNIGIYNLTLDANAGIQVNEINTVVMLSSNVLISNCLIKDGYKLLVYNGSGGHLQINDTIFEGAEEKHVEISGNVGVQVDNVIFNELSTINGVCVLDVGTDYGSYTFRSTARCPVCINVSGSNNVFISNIQNATSDYSDTGENNTINVANSSAKENYPNGFTANLGGVKYNNQNGSGVIEASNLDVESSVDFKGTNTVFSGVNPVTYSKPVELNQFFGGVKYWDNAGGQYNVLTDMHMTELLKAINQGAWLDAVSYGCDNTGETDCTELINEMLLTNKPVIFRPGTYLVSDYIMLQNGTVIFGYGATFKGVGNDKYCFFADGTSNIFIAGVDVEYFRRAFDFRNGSCVTLLNVSAHDMYRDASVFEDNYMAVFLNYDNIYVNGAVWNNLNENGDFLRLKNGNKNVVIENCDITAGDDAFALVPDEGVSTNQSLSNVTIRNCTINAGSFRGFRIQSERSALSRVLIENCAINCNKECAIISSTSDGSTSSTMEGVYEQIEFKNCNFNGGGNTNTPHIKINTASQLRLVTFRNCWFASAKVNDILVQNCNIYGLFVDMCRFLGVSGGGTVIQISDSTVNNCDIRDCYVAGSSQSTDKFIVVDGNSATVFATNNRTTGLEYFADFVGNSGTANLIIAGNLGGYNYLLNSDANTRLYGSITSNSTSNTNVTGSAIGVVNGWIKTEVIPTSQAFGYVYVDGTNNRAVIRLNNNQQFVTENLT